MPKTKIEPFKVIGILVSTTNENGQSAQDIGQLCIEFMSLVEEFYYAKINVLIENMKLERRIGYKGL